MRKWLIGVIGILLGNATLCWGQLGYQLGETIPPFSLQTESGQSLVPQQQYAAAAAIVLLFHDPNCTYEQVYRPRIQSLADQFQEQGVVFLLINPHPLSTESIPVSPPLFSLRDTAQLVASAFGLSRLPQAFVLRPQEDQQWVLAYLGAIDDAPTAQATPQSQYLRQAIVAILNGEPIQQTYTRASGCLIEWEP